MIWLRRILVLVLKLSLLLVVTMMVKFQIPELQYDFSAAGPAEINSVDELSIERFRQSTFAAVRGRPDFGRAATYASHGVPFTYFLLDGYGPRLVVRTPELVDKDWAGIDLHVGRLRPYHRMPFSRSVRAGFHQLFGVSIPDDALFLARDDVPQPNGWSIGALVFAGILWCVLAYFFFIRRRDARPKGAAPSERVGAPASGDGASCG